MHDPTPGNFQELNGLKGTVGHRNSYHWYSF